MKAVLYVSVAYALILFIGPAASLSYEITDTHDPLRDNTNAYYSWAENNVEWSSGEDGYVYGWYGNSAIISWRKFHPVTDTSYVFRFYYDPEDYYGMEYGFGLAYLGPGTSDFTIDDIEIGVYIDYLGTLHPAWDASENWGSLLYEDTYDLRMELEPLNGLPGVFSIDFDLVRVGSFDAPLSDFSLPVWSRHDEWQFILEECHLQICPHGINAKAYDVWDKHYPYFRLFLDPINPPIVFGGDPAVFRAHATYAWPESLTYGIDDPRFVQSDTVFTWHTTQADTGIYFPTVWATNGVVSDSAAVKVTVLPFMEVHHDSMMANVSQYFKWHENEVDWYTDEGGYLTGRWDWYSAVVSEKAFATGENPLAAFRFYLGAGTTNYMIGYTRQHPRDNTFHFSEIETGIYIHSSGSIRPSWDYDNEEYWPVSLAGGIYDLLIHLDSDHRTADFYIMQVSDPADTVPVFAEPVWSASVPRPLYSYYHVQINAREDACRLYDVWTIMNEEPVLVLVYLPGITVFEGDTVTIEPRTMYTGAGLLLYSIDDPNFSWDGATFTWVTAPGDAGVYYPEVTVTDGTLSESQAVKVTVIGPSNLQHDPMADNTVPLFSWHEQDVTWHPEEYGYVSCETTSSWYAGVVSGAVFGLEDNPVVTFRFERGITGHMLGFTATHPDSTDYHYSHIENGVYIHSLGTIRPTWDINNKSYWSTTLPQGLYDLTISLDRVNGVVDFSIGEVTSLEDSLPAVRNPLWSSSVGRPISDACYVQINTYNEVSKVFDVWAIAEEGPTATYLSSFSVSAEGQRIALRWTLSSCEAEAEFVVLRRNAPDGRFARLSVPVIPEGDLSFACIDTECEPGVAYAYRVDVIEGGGRKVLFETGIVSISPHPVTLCQNRPNPFNPSTEITYFLPTRGHVLLDVYDVGGRHIRRLVNKTQRGGYHSISWDGRNDGGGRVGTGVYFYRLRTGKRVLSRKMVLLR
ncbi:MAG: T9SS type A sorting domain-containing protein [bacterium]|nr:MAG: T9SS type A sorting domain-containing protein [bacterium]